MLIHKFYNKRNLEYLKQTNKLKYKEKAKNNKKIGNKIIKIKKSFPSIELFPKVRETYLDH